MTTKQIEDVFEKVEVSVCDRCDCEISSDEEEINKIVGDESYTLCEYCYDELH